MHDRTLIYANLSVKDEKLGSVPVNGYIYKENEEFVVLFPESDREKRFSWLDMFRFKVVPEGFVGKTWTKREETFSVLDDFDEKWRHGHKADQMPLHVMEIEGKCPAKKAKVLACMDLE